MCPLRKLYKKMKSKCKSFKKDRKDSVDNTYKKERKSLSLKLPKLFSRPSKPTLIGENGL